MLVVLQLIEKSFWQPAKEQFSFGRIDYRLPTFHKFGALFDQFLNDLQFCYYFKYSIISVWLISKRRKQHLFIRFSFCRSHAHLITFDVVFKKIKVTFIESWLIGAGYIYIYIYINFLILDSKCGLFVSLLYMLRNTIWCRVI